MEELAQNCSLNRVQLNAIAIIPRRLSILQDVIRRRISEK